MTLQQFNHLLHTNKKATIWKKGEHIASRHYGPYSITLWQIGAFYVEVYFDMLRRQITAFESFEDDQRLDPYLAQVDISPLLQEA